LTSELVVQCQRLRISVALKKEDRRLAQKLLKVNESVLRRLSLSNCQLAKELQMTADQWVTIDPERALALDREAERLILPEYHGRGVIYAGLLDSLALAAQAAGRVELASDYAERSFAIKCRASSKVSIFSAPAFEALSKILEMQGRYTEARKTRLKAVELAKKVYGADSQIVAKALFSLAEVEARLRNHDAARQAFAESLRIRERVLPADNPFVIACRARLKAIIGATQ